jgi:hypothetical protein
MAGAKIGALHVALGIDTAQFSAGLKKAQSGLAAFGKVAAVGLAAATTAAVAAGAALAVAGQKAINAADNMSKAAQKVGVATEALSRLNYAAGYSDVSLEQLTGGLQRLTRSLADVASGKGGTAATALQALGISATDTSGRLRAADEVFTEIADRFGRLEDGSTKTALAIQLFGRSGAELIPLLNSGRDGLKEMADESDRLGLTISARTGRAAEAFNDTLTKISRIVEGVAMQVAESALPALQDLADAIASPQFASAAEWLAKTVVGALTSIIEAARQASDALGYLATHDMFGNEVQLSELAMAKRRFDAKKVLQGALKGGAMSAPGDDFFRGMFGGSAPAVEPPPDVNFPTFTDAGAGEAMARRLEALRESLRTEEESERESYARRREEIQKFYDDGVIQRSEFDALMLRAQQDHADQMVEIARRQAEEEARMREQLVDNVASVFGSLSTLAENMGERGLAASKAFGVAEAIVNTAQGITKALAQGGIFGFAGAAAVAAAGAAQISTILSASKGSSSKPAVGGAAGEVASASQAPARSISINLQGDTFSRESVGGLFERLSEELGVDGLQLVTTYKQA